MTFVYIVRCRFTAPDKEAAWNAWYSGPKIEQMLAKPHFRTCQRFHRASGTGRDYLALWTMTSPQALKTKEYTSQWGFAEWERHVTDWSRDLFDAGERPEADFAVEPAGALRVIAFDGMGAGEAAAARDAVASAGPMMWLPITGLDRHTPMIGLAPLTGATVAAPVAATGIQDAVYRPISPLYSRR
jgi:hypothetical protein